MYVFVRLEDEVGVNLVRDDVHAVPAAQLCHFFKFGAGEYASCRIVRVAHQKYACLSQTAVQMLEVYFESVFGSAERILDYAAAVEACLHKERRIDGRLDYHSVALFAQRTYGEREAGHYTR